jgi:hypothetical protein
METVRDNILSEGDRHLRGKLAEMVFERLRDRLLQKLTYCSTWKFRRMLADQHLKFDLKSILAKFKTGKDPIQLMLNEVEVGLNRLRESLDIEKSSLAEVRWGNCILCGEKGEVWIHSPGHVFHFYFCEECLSKCQKSKLVYGNALQSGEYEPILRFYEEAITLSEYSDAFKVLSKLDDKKLNFLMETYMKLASEPGQTPFDYLGIDEKGHAYLFDVTSTKLSGVVPSLSKRERAIAKEAMALGFKIVRPVIRFFADWWVEFQLKEAR